MGAVLLAYLLLGAHVTVRAQAGLSAAGGTAQASIGALGLRAQLDATLTLQGGRLRLTPRYGARRERGKKSAGRAWRAALRTALRVSRGAFIQIHLRAGLPEAHETALLTGAARAVLSSLLAAQGGAARCELAVRPDYVSSGLVLTARCIFSFTPGDIMLAALREGVKKRLPAHRAAKEKRLKSGEKRGNAWPIPSRA